MPLDSRSKSKRESVLRDLAAVVRSYISPSTSCFLLSHFHLLAGVLKNTFRTRDVSRLWMGGMKRLCAQTHREFELSYRKLIIMRSGWMFAL